MEEGRLAQLLEALPVGVFILDASGHAVYANAAADALLGRAPSPDDAANNLAQRYAAYISGTCEPYPNERMPIVRALAGEKTVIDDMEIERDGERVALEVTGTPIFDANGALVFAVAVFKDVTPRRVAQRALAALNENLEREVERRTAQLARTVDVLEKEIRARHQTEQELRRAKVAAEQASRAKSVFLMNVSHELRTPLHHIIGFTELLTERLADEHQRKLAATAEASGRELLEKIDELIELARAEADPAMGAATRFDFDDVLQDVASETGVRCDHAVPVGTIHADELLVRRILIDTLERAGVDASFTVSAHHDGNERRAVITIPSAALTTRLRAIAHLFGEADDEATRFLQQDIDIRLAIARVQMRRLGGDIVALPDSDVAQIVVPAA
ncbi:MAG TPA: histidine kinase dimerization/phospho-acceptor domain-containing protein [Thermoanaerobaculia bacterium]|nr:histidine kinase dimerization/phospho-acceptor domain-containing protein [Thermoanaerobaculia bacterium]